MYTAIACGLVTLAVAFSSCADLYADETAKSVSATESASLPAGEDRAKGADSMKPFEVHYTTSRQGREILASRTFFRGRYAVAELMRGDQVDRVLFDLDDAAFLDVSSGRRHSLSECDRMSRGALQTFKNRLATVRDDEMRQAMWSSIDPTPAVTSGDNKLVISNEHIADTLTGKMPLSDVQRKRYIAYRRLALHRNWIIDKVNPPILDFVVLNEIEELGYFPSRMRFTLTLPQRSTTTIDNTYAVVAISKEMADLLDDLMRNQKL